MNRKLIAAATALGIATAPIAAQGIERASAPVEGESTLAGQGTLFFLLGIAVVAAAVVLLPEDEPASP